MKNNISKSLVVIAAALLCVGCVDELKEVAPAYNPEIADGEVKSVEFVIPGFVEEDGGGIQTKTTLTSSGFVWAEKDTVGIFPSKGNQIYYEMSSGAGSSSAEFDGGGWALKDEHLYSSYYPLQGDFYLDRKAIPVTYDTEVTQVGNNNSDHLGANAFMFAPETKLSYGKVTFKFWQLGSVLKPRVTLPAGTYTKLVLSTDEPIFVVSGKYDLTTGVDATSSTATYPEFVPVIVPEAGGLTNKLTINLENVTFSSETELIAYIMAAPVDVSNIPITVTIYCGDSPKYRYEFVRTSSFVAQTNHNIRPNEKGLMSVANTSESANAAFAAGETSLSLVDVTENVSLDLVLPETSEPVSIIMAADEGKCAMSVSYPAGATVPEELNIKASNGSDLTINTPESTVTLDGERTYNSVRASTASNTLIIDEDVTIGTLYLEKGNVQVYGEIMALNTDDLEEGETPTVYVYGNIQGQVDDDDVTVVEPDLVDLSSSGTANSYLVVSKGRYRFNANVKGNSSLPVGTIKSAAVVWESFGTAEMPKVGDIISSVSVNNGYVTFKTTGRDGNALIAVKDGSGTILWSWHIWCASEGFEEQIYANNAGTMMDRNLGALRATPGDDKAVGLYYQWGRKDPFLYYSLIAESSMVKSTIAWPTTMPSGTLSFSIANPTTMLKTRDKAWHTDGPYNNDWGEQKTIYDPCPIGWRVLDKNVWKLSSINYEREYDASGASGVDMSAMFLDKTMNPINDVCWYPLGDYWSNCYYPNYDEDEYGAYEMWLTNARFNPLSSDNLCERYSVRCQKEGTGGGASSVSISAESLAMSLGDSKQITATVMPSNSFQGVTWSSNNTACVSVDSGILTALSCGTATVTATSVSNPDIKASCLVTVTDPNNDESNPLTFVANGPIDIALEKTGSPYDITLYYSVNGGDWTPYSIGESISISDKGRLSFRAGDVGNSRFSRAFVTNKGNNFYQFVASGTGTCSLRGNINSLLDPTLENKVVPADAFFYLFKDMTALTDASYLCLPFLSLSPECYFAMFMNTSIESTPALPATSLATSCYEWMFSGCKNLTSAKDLPSTALQPRCYAMMFSNCTKLKESPNFHTGSVAAEECCQEMFERCTSLEKTVARLDAMTLAPECYYYMYYQCSSLKTAPELPATTLADRCYANMFQGCTSLDSIQEMLPAMTMRTECYNSMFSGCSSLPNCPKLPATTMAERCYQGMFRYCANIKSMPELPSKDLAPYCYSSMFFECSSLSNVTSILPATELKEYCYEDMFYNCTSMTKAPILPAQTLVSKCYHWMFYGCENLTWVKALFGDSSFKGEYCDYWLYGIYTSGTFIKSSRLTIPIQDIPIQDNISRCGIPRLWTIITDMTDDESVDLGLPSGIKWATCNVGASSPEEYGNYYAWGETETKTNYRWSTYFDSSNGSSSLFNKYYNDGGKTVLNSEDDVAHVKLGGKWRMPTDAEIRELIDNCQCEWVTYNGVSGRKFTSKKEGYTDNWIFLPAAGYYEGMTRDGFRSCGNYWSSSLRSVNSAYAWGFCFSSSNLTVYSDERFYGQSVRPVCE